MIKAVNEIASISDIKNLEIPEEEKIKNEHSKILERCEICKEVIRYKTNNYEFMRDCKCMRKYRVEARLNKFRSLSITDRNFKSDIFMNAKIGKSGAEAELYRKIKNYVKGFDEVLKLNDGLLFRGDVGTGKTFLANCICNFLIDKGYAVLSFKLADYLRVLREDFEKKTGLEGKLLEAAKEADMLFIDDLGSEKLSEDWGKEKFNSLIDTRYGAKKPILITTNLTATEMIDFRRYKNSDKILDRINQMTKTFDFTWDTKRKPNKKSFWEE